MLALRLYVALAACLSLSFSACTRPIILPFNEEFESGETCISPQRFYANKNTNFGLYENISSNFFGADDAPSTNYTTIRGPAVSGQFMVIGGDFGDGELSSTLLDDVAIGDAGCITIEIDVGALDNRLYDAVFRETDFLRFDYSTDVNSSWTPFIMFQGRNYTSSFFNSSGLASVPQPGFEGANIAISLHNVARPWRFYSGAMGCASTISIRVVADFDSIDKAVAFDSIRIRPAVVTCLNNVQYCETPRDTTPCDGVMTLPFHETFDDNRCMNASQPFYNLDHLDQFGLYESERSFDFGEMEAGKRYFAYDYLQATGGSYGAFAFDYVEGDDDYALQQQGRASNDFDIEWPAIDVSGVECVDMSMLFGTDIFRGRTSLQASEGDSIRVEYRLDDNTTFVGAVCWHAQDLGRSNYQLVNDDGCDGVDDDGTRTFPTPGSVLSATVTGLSCASRMTVRLSVYVSGSEQFIMFDDLKVENGTCTPTTCAATTSSPTTAETGITTVGADSSRSQKKASLTWKIITAVLAVLLVLSWSYFAVVLRRGNTKPSPNHVYDSIGIVDDPFEANPLYSDREAVDQSAVMENPAYEQGAGQNPYAEIQENGQDPLYQDSLEAGAIMEPGYIDVSEGGQAAPIVMEPGYVDVVPKPTVNNAAQPNAE
eukprot:m.88944 g.88944  ORF g.88944 m.88944 type:complete len:656 (-) comp14843_c0_seq1:72-2039(-)